MERTVETISGVFDVGADSGCMLGMIGVLGAVVFIWWTLCDTMLLSVGAGLMRFRGRIPWLRGYRQNI